MGEPGKHGHGHGGEGGEPAPTLGCVPPRPQLCSLVRSAGAGPPGSGCAQTQRAESLLCGPADRGLEDRILALELGALCSKRSPCPADGCPQRGLIL